MKYVVDANIAVKWFVPETHCERARRLLGPGTKLIAQDLLWSEFGSVMRKKLVKQEISIAGVSEIIEKLERVSLESYPTASLLAPALALAYFTGVSVYDAFYLALADRHRCALVTADRQLCELSKKTDIRCMWIEDVG